MAERVTFLLAVIGYAGLTVSAVLAARGRVVPWLLRSTAVVVVTHVALVWTVRYGWSWAQATRDGYAGALIFHSALALIVASVFVAHRLATRLLITAFAIVSVGAVAAVFMDDAVAVYRPVVIGLAVIGALGVAHALHAHRDVPER